jgi:hypothetical protein
LKNVHHYDSAALDAFSSTLYDVHLIKPIKALLKRMDGRPYYTEIHKAV